MKVPKLLASSADQEKFSLTLKGILLGIVPVIILVTNAFGGSVDESNLTNLVNNIINLASVGLAFLSALMTVYGAGRKVYHLIFG